MEKHELLLRDARTGARLHADSSPAQQGAALEDDLFVAKSVEDHIKQSERYVPVGFLGRAAENGAAHIRARDASRDMW